MNIGDIHVGDCVIVRDWEDMLDEYGSDLGGRRIITPLCHFVPSMKPTCGLECVVTDIQHGGVGLRNRIMLRCENPNLQSIIDDFTYTEHMLRPADPVPDSFSDFDEFSGLLQSF